MYVRLHQDGVFDKFLHTIYQTVTIATRHESLVTRLAFVWEMGIGLGNRWLIGDGKHTHPAAEDTQGVDCIEWLRSTTYLGNGKRSALCWTDTSSAQRYPINLILENAGLVCAKANRSQYHMLGARQNQEITDQSAVLFRWNPNMPIAPLTELSELLYFRMTVVGIVLHW